MSFSPPQVIRQMPPQMPPQMSPQLPPQWKAPPSPPDSPPFLGTGTHVVDYMDTSPIDPPPFHFGDLREVLDEMDTSE